MTVLIILYKDYIGISNCADRPLNDTSKDHLSFAARFFSSLPSLLIMLQHEQMG